MKINRLKFKLNLKIVRGFKTKTFVKSLLPKMNEKLSKIAVFKAQFFVHFFDNSILRPKDTYM